MFELISSIQNFPTSVVEVSDKRTTRALIARALIIKKSLGRYEAARFLRRRGISVALTHAFIWRA